MYARKVGRANRNGQTCGRGSSFTDCTLFLVFCSFYMLRKCNRCMNGSSKHIYRKWQKYCRAHMNIHCCGCRASCCFHMFTFSLMGFFVDFQVCWLYNFFIDTCNQQSMYLFGYISVRFVFLRVLVIWLIISIQRPAAMMSKRRNSKPIINRHLAYLHSRCPDKKCNAFEICTHNVHNS